MLVAGGLCGAALAVGAVWMTVDLIAIVSDVRTAQRTAAATGLRAVEEPGELAARTGMIESRLRRAARRAENSWTLGLVRHVPLLGAEVQAVRGLTSVGAQMGALASNTAGRVEDILDDADRYGADQRARLLRDMADEVDSFHTALARLPDTPGSRLPGLRGPSAGLREQRRTLVGRAGDAVAGLRSLADLVEGPGEILVLGANNAEMRAGAGMVLTAAMVQTDSGRIRPDRFRPTESLLLDESVPLPADFDRLYGWLEPGREWRNTGVSPHFPATAPTYSEMARRAGLGDPDAVVLVDVAALRDILDVVGPVSFLNRTVRPDTVERLVLHDLYVDFARDRSRRQDGLAHLAEATLSALDGRDWSLRHLTAALLEAAQGRHLMAWSPDPDLQRLLTEAGIHGGVGKNQLLVSVQNHGANKLDWFVQPRTVVETADVGSHRRVEISLAIPNPTPPGLPRSVIGGSQPGLAPGDYRAFVSLHLPASATDLTMEPWIRPRVAGRVGHSKVVGFRVDIRQGDEWQGRITFFVPDDINLVIAADGRIDRSGPRA